MGMGIIIYVEVGVDRDNFIYSVTVNHGYVE